MKRLLALILVLAMIFAFASCTLFGGDSDDTDKDENNSSDIGGDDDDGINGQLPSGGIDLPLVDIEPDGIE